MAQKQNKQAAEHRPNMGRVSEHGWAMHKAVFGLLRMEFWTTP